MTYKVKDILLALRDATNTVQDLSGNSFQPQFTNQFLLRQFKYALDDYAQRTKAIEDIYTVPISTREMYIEAPPLALRSEAYRFIVLYVGNRAFPCDIETLNNAVTNFPYQPITGVGTWIVPFQKLLYFFPQNPTNNKTAKLNKDISAEDTTIEIDSTTLGAGEGFLTDNGYITIGDEVIKYLKRVDNVLSGCIRGWQQTIATSHPKNSLIKENNVHIWYFRKHIDILPLDNYIDDELANTVIEVDDAHVELMINYAAYKALIKVDTGRATAYRVDWEGFINEAIYQINKGRSSIKKTSNIRNPYGFESGIPYWGSGTPLGF